MTIAIFDIQDVGKSLLVEHSLSFNRLLILLSCSIKLVNAIVSAERRKTPITDVSSDYITQYKLLLLLVE